MGSICNMHTLHRFILSDSRSVIIAKPRLNDMIYLVGNCSIGSYFVLIVLSTVTTGMCERIFIFPLLMFPTILINSPSPFDPLVSWWKNWRGSDLSPGSKSLSRSRGCCNSSSILASWDVISAVWIRCWSLTTWITPWVSWSSSWWWCSRPDCAFWCE